METYKDGDIYRFEYNAEYKDTNPSWNWCFDGQFVVNSKRLYDTYWLSKHDNFTPNYISRFYTIENLLKNGKVNFVCNIYDTVEITSSEVNYYAAKDLFDLSYQHKCYKFFVKRRGAARDKETMLKNLSIKILNCKTSITSLTRRVQIYEEYFDKISAGDTNINFL